jgi:hypothetical protein
MNERIKELWDQAAKLESDTSWEGQTRFMEKFAELIIRECIRQAHGVADLRGVNEDMVYGADTAAVRIHRHFGVENE